MYVRRGLRLR